METWENTGKDTKDTGDVGLGRIFIFSPFPIFQYSNLPVFHIMHSMGVRYV